MPHLYFTEDKRENLASGDASHGPSGAVGATQKEITSRRGRPEASVQGLVDRFTDMKAGRDENVLVALETRKLKAMWIYQNKRWVKRDVPREFPDGRMRFCTVTGGIIGLGGEINYHHKCSMCYYYSFSEQCWQKLPDMRTPRAGASCAEIKNMVVMVVGGRGGKEGDCVTCEILDIKRGQWFPAAPLSTQFSSYKKTICVASGRIFILGMDVRTDKGYMTGLVEYDPVSDTFSKKASAPISTSSLETLTAVEDKMYVTKEGLSDVIFQYDSITDQWTELYSPSTLHNACFGCSAVPKGRSILLCGRISGGGEVGKHIEEFNTVTHKRKVLDICLPFGYYFATSFVGCVNASKVVTE